MTSGKRWPNPTIAHNGDPCGPEPYHGTSTGYRQYKCRGADCRRWNADRQLRTRNKKNGGVGRNTSESENRLPGQGVVEMGKTRVAPEPGGLVVECWCHQDLVSVPIEDIGRTTRSCGRERCHPDLLEHKIGC